MTKEAAAWLIVRGGGLYCLIHTFLGIFNVLSQALLINRLREISTTPEIVQQIATAQAWAYTFTFEAVVAALIAAYLLWRGRTIHSVLVKHPAPERE